MKQIKKLVNETVDSISTFSSHPIESIGMLLPAVIGLIGLVCGLISYVLFIVRGGYSGQIGIIKERGFEGIFDCFTSGTSFMMQEGIVSKIAIFLLVLEVIVLQMNYFMEASAFKRITMIIDVAVLIIGMCILLWLYLVGTDAISLGREMALGIFKKIRDDRNSINVYLAIFIIALIVFFILLFVTDASRNMTKNTLLCVVVSYVGIPLSVLILENIIPLMGVALVVFIFKVVVKLFLGGEAGGSNSSYSYDDYSKDKTEAKRESGTGRKKEFNLSTDRPFWRGKAGGGLNYSYGDYVCYKNSTSGVTEIACGVKEFEDGTIQIINKGKRVTEVPGCKVPKQ